MEKTESESISFRKKKILFRDVNFGDNIREKNIKDITVSLEILLPFSIWSIFSPFKGLFEKIKIIIFPEGFVV